jgi:hypothetical protein
VSPVTHPLVLGLFHDATTAARAAKALRDAGHPREQLSIVARSHAEEGAIADAAGASPGAEIEDSRPAGRVGELSAHFIAAIAFVMPGIGPIVADGPLAASFGEAAGHVAGDIGRMLARAGLPRGDAEAWETRIKTGACLLGVHTDSAQAAIVAQTLREQGAAHVATGTWSETDD